MSLTLRPEQRPPLVIPRRPGLVLSVHPVPVLLVAAMFAAPLFLDEYWSFNVAVGLTLGISCLGLAVLTGWGRQISLMHAGVTGAAMYLSAWAVRELEWREWKQRIDAAALAGGQPGEVERPDPQWLVGAAVGIGFAVAAYLTVGLIVRRLGAAYIVALTFAGQFALENTIFTRDEYVCGLSECSLPRPEPFGISFQSERRYYYLVALMVLLVVLGLHRIRTSRYGRAIVFAAQQPEAAAVAGISPWRYRVVPWVLAGVCAGASGFVQGPMYRSPPGTLQYVSLNSLFYLAVAVLAGGASLLAVVVVAVVLHLAPELLLNWKLNVYLLGGVGMAIGALLGPRGIGGAVIDLCVRRHR